MCHRPQFSSLSVMFLRIDSFIRGPAERSPKFFDCFACTAVPLQMWITYGRVVYWAVGLHCEDHADVFHEVSGNSAICCTPHYHPDNEYAWRTEGRQILAEIYGAEPEEAEPAEAEPDEAEPDEAEPGEDELEEPVPTPSTTSSQH